MSSKLSVENIELVIRCHKTFHLKLNKLSTEFQTFWLFCDCRGFLHGSHKKHTSWPGFSNDIYSDSHTILEKHVIFRGKFWIGHLKHIEKNGIISPNTEWRCNILEKPPPSFTLIPFPGVFGTPTPRYGSSGVPRTASVDVLPRTPCWHLDGSDDQTASQQHTVGGRNPAPLYLHPKTNPRTPSLTLGHCLVVRKKEVEWPKSCTTSMTKDTQHWTRG